MKLGRNTNRRSRFWLVVVGLIILIAAIIAALHIYKRDNYTPVNTNTVSNAQLIKTQKNQAQTKLDQKDYQQAQQSYIAAATAASNDNNIDKAIDILQDGLKKIPDTSLTWEYYDTLSALAKMANNKSLEISSLKKALAKAQQPDSGAPSSTIDIYTKRLKELGAG